MKSITLFMAAFAFSTMQCVNSQPVKEDRKAEGFTGIDLSVPAHVYLTQGNEYKVTLEGDPKDLKEIETNLNGHKLIIETRCHHCKFEDLKIYISMPKIDHLEVNGSGDFIAMTPIKSDTLEIDISGSGSLTIKDLKIKTFKVEISGSGDIEASGNSEGDSMEAEISGSGKINLESLAFKVAKVEISGSGKIRLNVINYLEAEVSGSGDVYYNGNPKLDVDVSGSGKVRPL